MSDDRDRGTEPTRTPPAYPIASVDNALRLLLLFRNRLEWRLSDIARQLDVADSTAHRLVAMLEYHGFLTRMPRTRGYRIGPSISTIGRNALGDRGLRQAVHPLLEQIVEEERETISMGILEGSQIHYVDAVEAEAVLRIGNRTGMKIPAHCTSAGKVLLAELPDDEVRRLYPEERLPTLTEASVSSRSVLFDELETIRERGFATSRAGSEDGIAALAVLIRDSTGHAVAAAALAAPINRWEQWDQAAMAARMAELLAPAARLLQGD